MKKSIKIFLLALLSLIILVIVSVFFAFYSQIQPLDKAAEAENVRIEVEYGTSTYSIARTLKENNLIKNPKLFYYAVRYPKIINTFCPNDKVGDVIELKSGIYYINPSMNYGQIVNTLSSGRQEYVVVSIPEGLTISKIGEELESKGICSKNDFRRLCYDEKLVASFGIPSISLEGFLFPDTYYFTPNMKPELVITMMVENFFEKIKTIESLQNKSMDDIFYTIKLASIVEREYRIPDEAPLISSVFVNRLRYNIGLYSCATIEYIITEVQGKPHPERILIEDTKIDSPYNTYKYAGLPPTPISNPGLIAINAAANPAKTKYYFFQIVDPEEGRHVFTSTFDEHISSHSLYTKKR